MNSWWLSWFVELSNQDTDAHPFSEFGFKRDGKAISAGNPAADTVSASSEFRYLVAVFPGASIHRISFEVSRPMVLHAPTMDGTIRREKCHKIKILCVSNISMSDWRYNNAPAWFLKQSRDEMTRSKCWLAVLALTSLLSANEAMSESFVRSAKSGVSTKVYTYHAHNEDCSEAGGVIKVLTKPQHGKLRPSRDVSPMKRQRFGPDACAGKAMSGFRVDYTSTPGYRGVDSFVIEYTRHGKTMLDSFSVNVD